MSLNPGQNSIAPVANGLTPVGRVAAVGQKSFHDFVTNPTAAGTYADPFRGIERVVVNDFERWILKSGVVYSVTSTCDWSAQFLTVEGNNAIVIADRTSSYWGQSTNHAVVQNFGVRFPANYNLKLTDLIIDGNGIANLGIGFWYSGYDELRNIKVDNSLYADWYRYCCQISTIYQPQAGSDRDSSVSVTGRPNRVHTLNGMMLLGEQGTTIVQPMLENAYDFNLYIGGGLCDFTAVGLGVRILPGSVTTVIGGVIQYAGQSRFGDTARDGDMARGWNVRVMPDAQMPNFIGVDMESASLLDGPIGQTNAASTNLAGCIPSLTKAMWSDADGMSISNSWHPQDTLFYFGTASRSVNLSNLSVRTIYNAGGSVVLVNPTCQSMTIVGPNAAAVGYVGNPVPSQGGFPANRMIGGLSVVGSSPAPSNTTSLTFQVDTRGSGLADMLMQSGTNAAIVMSLNGSTVTYGTSTNTLSHNFYGDLNVRVGQLQTYSASSVPFVVNNTSGQSLLMLLSNGANNNTLSLGVNEDSLCQNYNSGFYMNRDAKPMGWNGKAPQAVPTVTGSRGGNAALASALTALDALGHIVNGTTT